MLDGVTHEDTFDTRSSGFTHASAAGIASQKLWAAAVHKPWLGQDKDLAGDLGEQATRSQLLCPLFSLLENTVLIQDNVNKLLWNAKKFTDYKIVCDGKTIPVHKAILCSASLIFDAACSGNFKETDGTYHVQDFPLYAVRRMLEYIYTGTYSEDRQDGDGKPATFPSKSKLHITMFTIGDRFMIAGLVNHACHELARMFDRQSDVEDFSRAVRDVYKITPHKSSKLLRGTVVEIAARMMGHHPCEKLDFDSLMSDCPDFVGDLAKRLFSCVRMSSSDLDLD
ncbi:hypothetical protein E4U42_003147 [Claviceps africana]|uniref:BTB domain-containing protein n=1 Tax=Claviceps africana TaxID=83212 RepID=A0A8K0J7J6_9HYPO|nr:hypothetical protein E4U42_003147 [Claviceps africana]